MMQPYLTTPNYPMPAQPTWGPPPYLMQPHVTSNVSEIVVTFIELF